MPPLVKVNKEERNYIDSYSYTHYNYLRSGLSSRLKQEHFEIALTITRTDFRKKSVIDFGCADGAFLPSLSRYFSNVLAIDNNPDFIDAANRLKDVLNLENVRCLTNRDLSFEQLKSQIGPTIDYGIIFLMEVIEHVGEHGLKQHKSRLKFLKEVSTLIKPGGRIIISVPIMTGLPFLLQRVGLQLFGLQREKYTFRELLCAVFNQTSSLEEQYTGYHKGFNHTEFEKSLEGAFEIEKKITTLVQRIYVLRSR